MQNVWYWLMLWNEIKVKHIICKTHHKLAIGTIWVVTHRCQTPNKLVLANVVKWTYSKTYWMSNSQQVGYCHNMICYTSMSNSQQVGIGSCVKTNIY